MTLTNCTITANSASSCGGILINHNEDSAVDRFYNSIIAQNTSDSESDSDIQCNKAICGYNNLSTYTGWSESELGNNLVYDSSMPLFKDAAGGNYMLADESPAINAGCNDYATVKTDLLGKTRIENKIVDLGVYEYGSYLIVTTLDDVVDNTDGVLSLREAIAVANSDCLITFDAALAGGTITLSGTELTISKSVTIDASALDGGITLNANQASRVLNITGATEKATANLYNFTFTGGVTSESGGGIYIYQATVALTNCSITGNSANFGGGIFNSGTLTLTNGSITGNSATGEYGEGGGIFNGETLDMTNVSITGNSATGECSKGGGIYNSGTLTLTNGSITGNSVNSGGGICNDSYTTYYNYYEYVVAGDMTLVDSTISENTAAFGGGIYNGGELSLTGCSIGNNTAIHSEGLEYTDGQGGGIYGYGDMTLVNSTIVGNSAYQGGGIYGKATFVNCTIAGNSAHQGGGLYDGTSILKNTLVAVNYGGNAVEGSIELYHSYLTSDPVFVTAPIFDSEGHLTNYDALNLQLQATSWLINAGDNSFVTESVDLAGNPRIYGETVDVGAYEFQGMPSERETASIIVTTEEDSFNVADGKTSLREAIYHAQSGDTITFDTSLNGKTIVLNTAELRITESISIDASALTDGITIDANHSCGIITITGEAENLSVSLTGLTMTGGQGKGIVSSGNLTMTRCVVSGNTASSDTYGICGGYVVCGNNLTLMNCSLTGNTAEFIVGGQLTLTDCSIINNMGTGVACEGEYGDCSTITNSVISDNIGGLAIASTDVTIINSIISGNTSKGGIYVYNTTCFEQMTLTNCVVSYNNTSNESGGGFYLPGFGYAPKLMNSIIVGNTANGSASDFCFGFSYYSAGVVTGYNNISTFADWSTEESGNNLVYDASKPLFTDAENGDYTLAAGSQAIDVGGNDYVTVETDIAGNARIQGRSVDMGAYESEGAKVSVSVVLSETAPTDAARSELEESLALTYTGRTVYAQVWMKNYDDSTSGITGGYMDLHYDSAAFSVSSVTSGAYYATMNNYYTLSDGAVTCFGGMAEMGQVSYGTDEWVLLGYVAMTVTGAGDSSISVSTPTLGGEAFEGLNIARNVDGVLKSSQIKFGSQAIETIQVVPLTAPANFTVVTGGANRAKASWDAVENASGYTLAYSTDNGASWVTVDLTETSYQITGLTYGASVSYKVMAKGNGAEWSDSVYTDIVSLKVCPMDIGGDGVINMNDYAVVSQAWFSRPGSSNWNSRADVDGDGIIGPGDFTFLSANWLKKTDDPSIIYPAAKAATFADGDFVEELGTDLDIDWDVIDVM